MAVEFYRGKIPIVTRDLNEGFVRGTPDSPPSLGCVPRDFDVDPVEMRDSPSEMKLIDPSEYDARFDEAEATESSLEHKYLPDGKTPAFEFLDQGEFPDCWAHSTAHCLMFDRLKQNLPVLRFNAVAVATMLGRTNGGWSGLSMKFARDNGYPVMGSGPGEWPQWTRKRQYDTPELRAAMKRHQANELWYDLGRREYNQVLTRRQIDTCGFDNIPLGVDFNEFGHAMCQIRRVRIEAGHWGDLILNSWKGFGYHGLFVLVNRTADNACGLRSSTPSAN
jgi:hypothetical protein